MAFTYVLTTDIGKVRLLIGDNDATSYQFEDDEITAFLTMASSDIYMAASYALESWASTLSASLKSEKIGDYSYTSETVANKIALAKKYASESAAKPVFEWSEFDLTAGSAITSEDD